jgi:hypothetical protein
MGRYASARDTGSTTGVATTILALLSAGTLAGITLVGVHQLAPAISKQLGVDIPSFVQAPAGVKVTSRRVAIKPHGASQGHPSKPRATAPTDIVVGPARSTSATPLLRVTDAVIHPVTAVVTTPPKALPPPTAVPSRPPLATPSPSALPRTNSRRHGYGSRGPESRRSDSYSRDRHRASTYSGRTARSHRGSSGCAGHAAGHHRAYPSNAYGDDRRRRAHGRHGSGNDRGAHGADRGAHGADRGAHGDDRGAHGDDRGHGRAGSGDSQGGHHSHHSHSGH